MITSFCNMFVFFYVDWLAGPDELWDHQVLVNPDPTYVGYKQNSPELTTNVDYLWRMPKGFPHPLPTSYYAGQINWGIPQLLQEATNNKRRGDKRIKVGRPLCAWIHTGGVGSVG